MTETVKQSSNQKEKPKLLPIDEWRLNTKQSLALIADTISKQTYTIKPGDSPGSIAYGIGISEKQLLEHNGKHLGETFACGEKIFLPNRRSTT